MKISIVHPRKSGFVLALMVLLVAVVVIGYLAYKIIKCIKKMPTRTLPPESAEVQKIREQALADVVSELQAEHPGEVIAVQSAEILFVPAFVPFDTNNDTVIVQRSTDLINWQTLGVLEPGERFADTNLMDRAFYRAFDAAGQMIAPSTNAGFEWREAR